MEDAHTTALGQDIIDLATREGWELSEGPEIEGRYVGLRTLFVNSLVQTETLSALHEAMERGDEWLERFAHLYVSCDLATNRHVQAVVGTWIMQWPLRPVTIAVRPADLKDVPDTLRADVHLQLILDQAEGLVRYLKPTDCIRVDDGTLRTFSFILADACAVTEPVDYAVDREVTLPAP